MAQPRGSNGQFVGGGSIGGLVVGLGMDTTQFKDAIKGAEADLKGLSKGLGDFTKYVNDSVSTAFKAAGAAMVSFGAASTIVGAKFENAIAAVGAISRASAEDMGKIEAKAREVGAATNYTAEQAANAMQMLAQAGFATRDVIAATGDAVYLAGATGASLETATGLMASSMSQFQLSATDATRVTDVFSRAITSSLFDVHSLTEAMKYAGTAGSGFGYSLEETTAAVAQFRNLGLEGSLAGTGFKMMLASVSKETDVGRKVLERYNLTYQDVSPTLHSFAEIMETVGKAGMSTADAMTIFGTRAGANVKVIADQFASGASTYYSLLDGLENSTGATQEMYGRMMDTIVGQFDVLTSAIDDLMISIFMKYSGPLKTLLQSLSGAVSYVGQQFNHQAGTIGTGVGGIMTALAKWVDSNRDNFVLWFRAMSEGFMMVMNLMAALGPHLDTVAKGLALIFIASKVYAFTQGIISAITAVKALVTTFMTLGTVSRATFAALGPIGLALGAVTLAIGAYQVAMNNAKTAAEKLADQQAILSERLNANAAAYEQNIGRVLEAQKTQIRLTLEQDAVTGELSEAERERLNNILKMDSATAAAKTRTAELVAVNGELVDVTEYINEKGNEGIQSLKEQAAATTLLASQKLNEASRYKKAIDEYNALVAKGVDEQLAFNGTVKNHADSVEALRGQYDAATQIGKEYAGQAQAIGDAVVNATAKIFQAERTEAQRNAEASESAAEQQANDTVDKRQQAADKTLELERRLNDEMAALGQDRTQTVQNELRVRVEEVRSTFSEEMKLYAQNSAEYLALEARQAQAIVQTRRILSATLREENQRALDEAQADLARARMTQELAEADDFDQRREALIAEYDAEASLYEANSAEMADLTERRNAALAALNASFLLGMETRERDAAMKRLEMVTKLELGEAKLNATALEQIEATRQQTLTDMALASAEERARINAVYDAQVARYREGLSTQLEDRLAQLTGERISRADDLERDRAADLVKYADATASEIADLNRAYDREVNRARLQDARDVFSEIATRGKAAAVAVADAFRAVGDVLAGAFDRVLGVFTLMSGFSFDLGGAVGDIAGQVSDSGGVIAEPGNEEAGGFDVTAAAESLVSGLIEGASGMISTFIAAAPALVNALAAQLPALLTQFAEGLPLVIQGIAVALPGLITAVVGALPILIDGIIAALPVVVTALAQSLPILIDGLLSQIPRLINAVVAALPSVLQVVSDGIVQILTGIPALLQTVLDAIPTIITSLLAAVPQIIEAVFNLIPVLIEQVIAALPMLIESLLIGLLDVIVFIAEQLPTLITQIILLVPELINAILLMLPMLITAIIGAVPQIILAIVAGLPQIIEALMGLVPSVVQSLIVALPQIASALVVAIFDLVVVSLPQIIYQLVTGLVEGIAAGTMNLIETIKDMLMPGSDTREAVGDAASGAMSGMKSTLQRAGQAVRGVFASGLDFAPQRMAVMIDPGEAIIPADKNPFNPAAALSSRSQAAGGFNGPPPIMPLPTAAPSNTTINVVIDGSIADTLYLGSMQNGTAPGLLKNEKRVSGKTKGFSVTP